MRGLCSSIFSRSSFFLPTFSSKRGKRSFHVGSHPLLHLRIHTLLRREYLSEAVANLIGRCPGNNAILSLADENESYSSSNLNATYAAAQTAFRANVGAAMCSDNFSGLFSKRQAEHQLGGTVIPHKSKQNEYQSCAGGVSIS
ncbi:hypothetical protein PsorP6_009061 [Peronosclerospora sorghi]|uniref:Uncharacterized protein n=1 Tax=Peronosclerospora sorghi TaxID=230839 RepID=A0ACC0W1H4_9STRA|nr:hypothetical protein PsorP6_009061 [Peronosclerospora sorghi]